MDENLNYTLSEVNRKLDLLLHLDNSTDQSSAETEDFMPLNKSKIKRHVKINDIWVWVCANNEQDYANKLIKLALGRANHDPTKKHNFGEYAVNWFNTYSKPNVAKVTALNYERQLNNRILPNLGPLNVEDISASDIQAVFNSIGHEAKQETKNKVKHVLNQIFKAAIDDSLIVKNPMDSVSLRIRGAASEETKPYSVEQMRYLASHLQDISDETERAWLTLSITLPLRPEEVLGLRWQDIDDICRTLTVNSVVTHPTRNEPEFKPYPKTASSRRTLALPQEVIDILPVRGSDDEFVIGGKEPVSYTKLRGMRKRISAATGFGEAITPRRFRTTVATDISAETHDLKLVQRMLGHSTPEMTLKHYDKGRNTTVDAIDAVTKCYGLTNLLTKNQPEMP